MRLRERVGAAGSGPSVPADGGTVTAELALGMVGLAVVLAAAVNVVQIGLVKLSTADAATAAARAVARGEDTAVAAERARHLAGEDSRVTVKIAGSLTTATVARRVGLTLPGGGGVDVTSTASTLTEDDGAAGDGGGP